MANVMVVFERIKTTCPHVGSLKELARYAWNNLNPRTFSVGRKWSWGSVEWRMAGHGSAADWYNYPNCITSGELVDFLTMLGASNEDAIALRDHLISQGFYSIVFDLECFHVIGRPSKYLLRINA